MKKNLCLAALVTVCACSRRPATPPPSSTPTPEITPHSQALQVGPPPPRSPAWKLPDFQMHAPDLRLPELPQLREPKGWSPPPLDPRFNDWHWQSFTPSKMPEMSRRFDQDFEAGMHLPKADVYSNLDAPGVRNMRWVLDDYEAQQKAMQEKYVPFPIPVSIPIPF